jgi:iron(II)-dependent oxidoreductase
MKTLARGPRSLDREALAQRYRQNRMRSRALFALIDPIAYRDRPISLRHPFVFYDGHLPTFSFLTFNERALGEQPIDAQYEKLFERGIDPANARDAAAHERADWPTAAQVTAFGNRCDERVLAAIATSPLLDDPNTCAASRQALYTILEHEEMHHETLMYIVHRLDADRKGRIAQIHHDASAPANAMIAIPRGAATLGANAESLAFGWDNEFGEHTVDVESFSIAQYPITNGDWLAYVERGGPRPAFWIEREGEFRLLGAFEELALPLSWPVYVTHDQACEYATTHGMRLPTEAEYHRAAFGTPAGHEQPFPWGTQPPTPEHGNFDFSRYDPEAVDAHPAGASAWGVYDLIGNGWEWTDTPFAPFPDFAPMRSYPQYSVDFFDGKHYVMKGASPVTSANLVRRSLRNWYYGNYPYVYAKFRVVAP